MTATVSVVIPVYNGGNYLAAAIESVLGQTIAPAEVLVMVDCASTDDSAAVAASYAARVTVLSVPPRAGAPATLNRGVDAAQGDFLCFLDADDLWLPGKTAAQLALLARRPGLDAVFGQVRQFISPDTPRELAARLRCPTGPMRGIYKGAMLIRRAAFARVGPFDESLRHVDFIDWYARATERGLAMHMLDEVVACRRIHGENYGVLHRAEQRADDLLALKRALDRRRTR